MPGELEIKKQETEKSDKSTESQNKEVETLTEAAQQPIGTQEGEKLAEAAQQPIGTQEGEKLAEAAQQPVGPQEGETLAEAAQQPAASQEDETPKEEAKQPAAQQGTVGVGTAEDEVKDEILKVGLAAADKKSGLAADEAAGEDAFDTLQELKQLKQDQPQAGKQDQPQAGKQDQPQAGKQANQQEDSGNAAKDESEKIDENGGDNLKELRENVNKARSGKIYHTVVLAKALEKGESNPMASSRFSRFLQSSVLDAAANVNKIAGSTSGLVANLSDPYSKSAINNSITIITNVIGLVMSIRDMTLKIKRFSSLQGKKAKIFGVIGMISEASMMLSKGCGIAKGIVGLMGKNNTTFARINSYLSLFLASTTQIAGLAINTDALIDLSKKLRAVKAAEAKKRGGIDAIIAKYQQEPEMAEGEETEQEDESAGESAAPEHAQSESAAPEQAVSESSESDQALSENTASEGAVTENEPDTQDAGHKETDKQLPAVSQTKRSVKALSSSERVHAIALLLKREDVSDEDKDELLQYLMMKQRSRRMYSALFDRTLAMVTLVTGLGSTIASATQLGIVANASKGDEDKIKSAKIASKTAGSIANFMGVMNASMGFRRKSFDNEQGQTLKGLVHSSIDELKDDRFGLKGVAASLRMHPDQDQQTRAKEVLKKYASADKRLQAMGVKYEPLLKAANLHSFNKILTAGI